MSFDSSRVEESEVSDVKEFFSTAGVDSICKAMASLPVSFQSELCSFLEQTVDEKRLEERNESERFAAPTSPDCKGRTSAVVGSPVKAQEYWKGVYAYHSLYSSPDVAKAPAKPVSNPNRVYVVLPSMHIGKSDGHTGGFMHTEERQLFQLLRLRDPGVHIIYITSIPVHPSTVQYYLSLLPTGLPDIGKRLVMMSSFDSSVKPLCRKVLERPRMRKKIKEIIALAGVERDGAYLLSLHIGVEERRLADALSLRLPQMPERAAECGSKVGGRALFKELGIAHPPGLYTRIMSCEELAKSVLELYQRNLSLKRVMVKLNYGESGEGNALLDLRPVFSRFQSYSSHFSASDGSDDASVHARKLDAIALEFPHMRFQAARMTWGRFKARLEQGGCVVEEYVEGKNKHSPSVQGVVRDDGVTLLSTHEQVLGGPDGQVFIGCRFPANPAYRPLLHSIGERVGRVLQERGVRGRFGVDFLAVPTEAQEGGDVAGGGDVTWDVQALEVNMGIGGTTHPFETLRLLTGGHYDLERGVFLTPDGEERHYIASDSLEKEQYQGLLPGDLKRIKGMEELTWDPNTLSGIVFHEMGALSQFGRLGVTCISDSPDGAKELFRETERLLDADTKLYVVPVQ